MWPFHQKRMRPAREGPATGERLTTTYGHYRILEREDGNPWLLGHGAMGLTYKAEDTNLRVPVALKVISPLIAEQPGAREFFLAEARGAASLRHRNAASVHHLGVNHKGELFFAMEFIEGETVEAVLARQQRLPALTALDFAQQTACALAAAGQRGLVHRDLKPANLMLRDEGDGTVVVKVIDFGLCKSLRIVPAKGRAAERQFLGTPHYASPEQIRCDPNLDQRADFYSLGATLWKMLAGRPLFDGPLAHVRQRHLEETPAFGDLPPEVSPPVRELLASLLHKEENGRPQSALELIDRIEAAAYDDRGAEADPRRHWKVQGCTPLLGSVLAHNYHLEAIADADQSAGTGAVFRAEDIAGQRSVAVQLIDRDQPLDAVRTAVERLTSAPHPNLTQNLAFSSCRGQPFVVKEWLSGFTLAAALRARGGRFTYGEAALLLGQAAAAVDHALAHGIGWLDLQAAAIQVHFTGSLSEVESRPFLPAEPVDRWSGFTLKLRALNEEFTGNAGALTGESVRRLGLLTAELLGSGHEATAAFFGSAVGGAQTAHLPSAPVNLQRLIDQAIATPGEFGSGNEYVAALKGALAG